MSKKYANMMLLGQNQQSATTVPKGTYWTIVQTKNWRGCLVAPMYICKYSFMCKGYAPSCLVATFTYAMRKCGVKMGVVLCPEFSQLRPSKTHHMSLLLCGATITRARKWSIHLFPFFFILWNPKSRSKPFNAFTRSRTARTPNFSH